MKIDSPKGYEIADLRKRHRLTQKKLAESLYGNYTSDSIASWEGGRRNCPPIVWWVMNITWEHVDLWGEE